MSGALNLGVTKSCSVFRAATSKDRCRHFGPARVKTPKVNYSRNFCLTWRTSKIDRSKMSALFIELNILPCECTSCFLRQRQRSLYVKSLWSTSSLESIIFHLLPMSFATPRVWHTMNNNFTTVQNRTSHIACLLHRYQKTKLRARVKQGDIFFIEWCLL